MHERIKKLAEQAGGNPNYKAFRGHFLPPPPGYIDPATVDLEKFAELIVRKCLSDCEAVKEQFYNGVIATTDVELKNRFAEAEAACDMIKTKIEMRFGVEL